MHPMKKSSYIYILILALFILPQLTFASPAMEPNGAMVNGKLQEHEQRSQNANKNGFDKTGFYVAPGARYEYESDMSDEEYKKWEGHQPSYYFNEDGTPKSKDIFISDEDHKRLTGHYPQSSPKYAADEAAMEKAKEAHLKRIAEKEAKQRAEAEALKLKQAESDARIFNFLGWLFGIPAGIWGILFVFRLFDYKKDKSLNNPQMLKKQGQERSIRI